VGLGVGAVAGIVAISEKSGANCDGSGACDGGPLSSAKTAAVVSDVGFIAGGVFLAAGAAILLFFPRPPRGAPSALHFDVAPSLDGKSARAALGGTF
jgi:hypothetical protein